MTARRNWIAYWGFKTTKDMDAVEEELLEEITAALGALWPSSLRHPTALSQLHMAIGDWLSYAARTDRGRKIVAKRMLERISKRERWMDEVGDKSLLHHSNRRVVPEVDEILQESAGQALPTLTPEQTLKLETASLIANLDQALAAGTLDTAGAD